MTIYVLTDGDYSDYHIKGVFSDRELAEKAKDKLGGELEEYEDNEIGKDNRFIYSVYFKEDTTKALIEYKALEPINKIRVLSYKNVDRYMIYVMAEDESHAIKITSDLLAQYKASK